MSYWGGGWPRYVTVAEKKAKAGRKLKQLLKKNKDIKPVIIKGYSIASTWWGKAWNQNLEKYADYHNRIGRGRSYVRNGNVLDLRICSGEIKSLVQGTRSKPYSVVIKIKGLKKDVLKKIKSACEGKLDSLQELLDGKFPEALNDIFTAKGTGLFPSPAEINFDCSCPDWADMCKHVAAALYGIGARLDEDPELFFKLRKVEIGGLIKQAVEGRARKLLNKAGEKKARRIDDSELEDVFGIEMDRDIRPVVKKKKKAKKPLKKAVKKAQKKVVKKTVRKIMKRQPGKRKRPR